MFELEEMFCSIGNRRPTRNLVGSEGRVFRAVSATDGSGQLYSRPAARRNLFQAALRS
jgi:hypothetical protein